MRTIIDLKKRKPRGWKRAAASLDTAHRVVLVNNALADGCRRLADLIQSSTPLPPVAKFNGTPNRLVGGNSSSVYSLSNATKLIADILERFDDVHSFVEEAAWAASDAADHPGDLKRQIKWHGKSFPKMLAFIFELKELQKTIIVLNDRLAPAGIDFNPLTKLIADLDQNFLSHNGEPGFSIRHLWDDAGSGIYGLFKAAMATVREAEAAATSLSSVAASSQAYTTDNAILPNGAESNTPHPRDLEILRALNSAVELLTQIQISEAAGLCRRTVADRLPNLFQRGLIARAPGMERGGLKITNKGKALIAH